MATARGEQTRIDAARPGAATGHHPPCGQAVRPVRIHKLGSSEITVRTTGQFWMQE
jgi:hypothetical protein